MLPIINIGPLAIQAPGLIIIIGLWIGLFLAEKYLSLRKIDSNIFNNLLLLTLISGVVGARLTYAIQYIDVFLQDPISLVSPNILLFDIRGGLLFACICGIIYAGRKGLDFWVTMDAITPVLGVLTITLGLSNLASGSNFGTVTNLPWAVELWGSKRHPTQIYQIVFSFLILVVLWPGRQIIQALKPGQYFLLFVAASSFGYIFIAPFIANFHLILGGLRREQIISWLILAASLWGIHRLSIKKI